MVKLPCLVLTFFVCSHSEGCKRKSFKTETVSTTTTTTTTTTISSPPPYSPILLTEPETFVVKEGDNVTLACHVDAIVSDKHEVSPCPCTNLQIVWKKGNKTIEEDGRLEVEMTENGSNLIIKDAQENDAGEFVCKVLDVEIRHTVEIIVKPEVVPVPESGLVIVKEGEPATIACKITKGGPKTYISWETSDGYPLLWLTDAYTIPKTYKWTAGVFKCTAQNGWPEPVSAEIRLEVQHAPDISITPSTDYTYEWTRLTPICYVEASPEAIVEWYKDGQKFEEDAVVANGIKRMSSRITLRDMGLGHANYNDTWVINQEKIGVYECRAKNYLGEAFAAIDVFGSCNRLSEDCFKIVKQVIPITGTENTTEQLTEK